MREEVVRRWDPDELLATPDQVIIDYLTETFSVFCPVLRHDEGTSTEPEPTHLPAYSPIPGIAFGDHGRPLRTVPGSTRSFLIPYDGDEEVFYCRPNPFRVSGQPPQVEIRSRRGAYHLATGRPGDPRPRPDQRLRDRAGQAPAVLPGSVSRPA